MFQLRHFRGPLQISVLSITRWSSISVRHISSTDCKERAIIHCAINLLFPGLGDRRYNAKYEEINQQINKASLVGDNIHGTAVKDSPSLLRFKFRGIEREQDSMKKLVDRCEVLTDLKRELPSSPAKDYIDPTILCNEYKPQFESEDEFYNEVLEFDKFNHLTKFNPLIFCKNSYHIERCAEVLFEKECDSQKISVALSNLRKVGARALRIYWQTYLERNLDLKRLNYSTIVNASGILNMLNIRTRNLIKRNLQTEIHYSNVFYQYLGLLVVENGQLSPHFIHSLARFLESGKRLGNTYWPMKEPSPEQVEEVEATIINLQDDNAILKKLIQFAEYTLKLIGKRTELLQGHLTQKKSFIEIVKECYPALNDETNMAKLGHLMIKDYKKYALDLLGFDEPKLSFVSKLHLIKVFTASNFELPVVPNYIPPIKSPYQILPPILNSNLINRILLLSKHLYFGTSENGEFMKLTLRNFQLYGVISYSFFTRLALERMEATSLTTNQLRKLNEIVDSHSFKSYIVDLMKFFENQEDRKSYMKNIEILLVNYLLPSDQFHLIFGCLSERQKERWCNDLITKIVTVMMQLNWQYIDDFLVELRSQLLKRKEYFNSVPDKAPHTSNSILLEDSQNGPVIASEMETSLYYNLTMEYLSYLNIKHHIGQPIGFHKWWLGVFEEKLLRTYGFDNVARIGYLLDDVANESIGMDVVKEFSTRKEAIDKSFMGAYINNKLKFRLGIPTGPFWNYVWSQLQPPKLNFESTINKFLLMNYKIAPQFFAKTGLKQLQILDTIYIHGELGKRYYRFIILFSLTKSKLPPATLEAVLNLFIDKRFKKRLNYVTGALNPFMGDSKMNHIYHTLMAEYMTSEFHDLTFHNQIFHQFIAMQLAQNEMDLVNWIKGLIEPLIKQLEGCNDEYDRQAVLFKFERAYQ